MAEGVEAIFTTSDDERYGRTGMLFGSELYQLSRQSSVREIGLKKLWSDYFHNCMIGDVRINGKYTGMNSLLPLIFLLFLMALSKAHYVRFTLTKAAVEAATSCVKKLTQ
uniref:conjugal transfer protein TraG N-terminal domain-containing protein n=1 Tax=Vibrio harveyi TaxID=669 RepID=UPI0021D38A9D|nr:conjugal transfer protein TraG N-terminal domain-containing protein [Vibrio harveyi]